MPQELSLSEIRQLADRMNGWQHNPSGGYQSINSDFVIVASHYEADPGGHMDFNVYVTANGNTISSHQEGHRTVRSVPQTTGPVRELHDYIVDLACKFMERQRAEWARVSANEQSDALARARKLLGGG